MIRRLLGGAALGLLGAVLLHGAALLLVPPGAGAPAGAVARLGVLLIGGVGLLAPFTGRPPTAVWLRELGALAAFFAGALAGALAGGLAPDKALHGAALAAGTPALLWCWTLPARVLRVRAAGPLLILALAAALLGTPWLAGEGYGPLPGDVLAWNPLVRLHWEVEGRDWLHGPLLYGLVGERAYHYAEGYGGQAPLLAGGPLVAGLGLLLDRRRRRSRAPGVSVIKGPGPTSEPTP